MAVGVCFQDLVLLWQPWYCASSNGSIAITVIPRCHPADPGSHYIICLLHLNHEDKDSGFLLVHGQSLSQSTKVLSVR